MISPNYDDTIAFLQKYRPMGKGFWLLMAIRVDKKETKVLPFSPDQTDEVRGWLEQYGADNENPDLAYNLYFHVNPTMRMGTSKASKDDIAKLEYLHVDLDPRPGEDMQEEKARFLAALTDKLPKDVPVPTFVVDSGAGYHAYWRLQDPMRIDGEPSKVEEAERYNQQLEAEFGGDHCWNIDRILRLPGTLNRPDKKKRDKGRTTYLCSLVSYEDTAEYPLDAFTPAPLVQTEGGFADHLSMVDIKGTVDFFNDVDKLDEWKVPLHTKIVIVQGMDPDEPDRWESRSEPLWYVTCQLTRHGVPDEVILSVLENPAFKISESVLEKGRGARKYALKQINDAKEDAISPELQRLNAKHAVVRSVGGSCRIISEEWDEELGRLSLDYQTASDFNTYYQNQNMEMMVEGKEGPKLVSVPLGKWWLTHPNRRSYERVIFAPGREVKGSYNLWTGFGCEARPGKCELYLQHLRENICSGNEEYFQYLLGWMASAVQRPGEQGHVAIVLQGARGAGKGVFASNFGALFGRHFLTVTHGDHLVGKFNAHLRDCVLLFGDEAFYAGDKKHEGMLKVLITERLLMTEKKGVDAQTGRNYTHVILASNDDWVVPAGENERRFFIMRVSDERMQDTKFFSEVSREMENGGHEALLHFLMHYDLANYNVRDVPKTDALQAQKAHSFSAIEEWWYSKLQDGEIEDGCGWPSQIPRGNLRENMVAYTKAYNVRTARANSTIIGNFMARVLPGDSGRGQKLTGSHTVIGEDGEPRTMDRPRGYVLPSIQECREHWENIFGGKFTWEEAPGQTIQSDLGLNEEAF